MTQFTKLFVSALHAAKSNNSLCPPLLSFLCTTPAITSFQLNSNQQKNLPQILDGTMAGSTESAAHSEELGFALPNLSPAAASLEFPCRVIALRSLRNAWQSKCTPALASSSSSVASSVQVPSQISNIQIGTDNGYCLQLHDVRQSGFQDSAITQVSSSSSIPDLSPCAGLLGTNNSFLSLLSVPPSQVQSDFPHPLYVRESSSSYPNSLSSAALHSSSNSIPNQRLTHDTRDYNGRPGSDVWPLFPPRHVASSQRSCGPVLHKGQDSVKSFIPQAGSLHTDAIARCVNLMQKGYIGPSNASRSSDRMPHGSNLCTSKQSPPGLSSFHHDQHPTVMSSFRVFCMNKSGDLLLSNTGLLAVVCSCHGTYMSISNFCEHSGISNVIPGYAVRMGTGETLAQWRTNYFSKLGIRVAEDNKGWEWPPKEHLSTFDSLKCIAPPVEGIKHSVYSDMVGTLVEPEYTRRSYDSFLAGYPYSVGGLLVKAQTNEKISAVSERGATSSSIELKLGQPSEKCRSLESSVPEISSQINCSDPQKITFQQGINHKISPPWETGCQQKVSSSMGFGTTFPSEDCLPVIPPATADLAHHFETVLPDRKETCFGPSKLDESLRKISLVEQATQHEMNAFYLSNKHRKLQNAGPDLKLGGSLLNLLPSERLIGSSNITYKSIPSELTSTSFSPVLSRQYNSTVEASIFIPYRAGNQAALHGMCKNSSHREDHSRNCNCTSYMLSSNKESKLGETSSTQGIRKHPPSNEATVICESGTNLEYVPAKTSNLLAENEMVKGLVQEELRSSVSELRDVPIKIKGVYEVMCINEPVHEIGKRGESGAEFKDFSAENDPRATKIDESLKGKELSNLSSGCSGQTVREVSIEVNIAGSSSVYDEAPVCESDQVLKTARKCEVEPQLTYVKESKKSRLSGRLCSTGERRICRFQKFQRSSSSGMLLRGHNKTSSVADCSGRSEENKQGLDKTKTNASMPSIVTSVQFKPKVKAVRRRSLYEIFMEGERFSSKHMDDPNVTDTLAEQCTYEMKTNKKLDHLCGDNSDRSMGLKGLRLFPYDSPCCVCGKSNEDQTNCILKCGQCSIKIHQACYGISRLPKGHWYCRPCSTNSVDIVCVLCGYGSGAMTRALKSDNVVKSLLKAWSVTTESGTNKKLACSVAFHGDMEFSRISTRSMAHNSITAGLSDPTVKQWVHMVCGLWTPGTRCPNVDTMSSFDVSGVSQSKANTVCVICKRSGGSCIRCRVPHCSSWFHPWCAQLKDLLQSEFEGISNEKIGFYGRCMLHAISLSGQNEPDLDTLGRKESTCARTEGYKGRKQDGKRYNASSRSNGKGRCAVLQEQLDAWLHINRQKMRFKPSPNSSISDVEHDYKKEYVRYKQTKSWKQLMVYKSGIHALGLYTSQLIPRGAMVVEYVGEVVGLRVADKREIEYQSGSKLQYKSACYFFRIDKEHIIDATWKGGIARFVNHSCMVVFFAQRDIYPGEEITYDYNFNNEDDGEKIPCFCNSRNCRRYLN
ncbi:hypothetical protein V2J09_009350 [Rumex salicifolius]